jgi:hypothetical protein
MQPDCEGCLVTIRTVLLLILWALAVYLALIVGAWNLAAR